MNAYRIKVYGKVQGVFFRANTLRKANELALTGWVKNDPDGTVAIAAEGTEEQLKALVDWCRMGPPYAEVNKVEFLERDPEFFKSFRIIH